MKKALSLIELIFTIVIIAIVFTVIPKIVFALSKSDAFAIKQDALFNGMTMTQMISRLAWDENSVNTNVILETNSSAFKCDIASKYRIGGFRGSRNCENNVSLWASGLGSEEGNDYSTFDDVDDFHGWEKNTTFGASAQGVYGLHVNVSYINDAFTYAGQSATIDLSKTALGTTSNLKLVDVNLTYEGKRTQNHGENIAQFSYVSANIGQCFIYKRAW